MPSATTVGANHHIQLCLNRPNLLIFRNYAYKGSNLYSIAMPYSKRRRTSHRKNRRTQSDILLDILRNVPSKKPASINTIAEKSKSTWRTASKTIDTLTKAGIIKRIREKGNKRPKYIRH